MHGAMLVACHYSIVRKCAWCPSLSQGVCHARYLHPMPERRSSSPQECEADWLTVRCQMLTVFVRWECHIASPTLTAEGCMVACLQARQTCD